MHLSVLSKLEGIGLYPEKNLFHPILVTLDHWVLHPWHHQVRLLRNSFIGCLELKSLVLSLLLLDLHDLDDSLPDVEGLNVLPELAGLDL